MNRFSFGILIVVPFLTISPLAASSGGEDVLKNLRPKHPRLYVLDNELPAIKQLIKNDPLVRRWYDRLQADAKKMLDGSADQPDSAYTTAIDNQGKVADPYAVSVRCRKATRRINILAGLYRLDGDKRKAEQARKDLLAAAALPEWYQTIFLSAAETTNAVAIGYDWLYEYLSEEDRATIRKAIVDKGLKPGLATLTKGDRWAKGNHNWNQVCNGGMTAGSLAIAESEPELARDIVSKARASIVHSMRSFTPDGGWEEGPTYWNYGIGYNTFYLAALKSALNTDFDFKKTSGLAETGLFRIHCVSPLKLNFNFADADEPPGFSPHMFWLAREFQRPVYAEHELEMVGDQPNIFHLLWYRPASGGRKPPDKTANESSRSSSGGSRPPLATLSDLPRDILFRRIHVACFRSAWNDPKALYVGFKGSDNTFHHAHLDLGTFVLDALGERWALDLGRDSYALPDYFTRSTGKRWLYYRLGTEGHNTLTIGTENQQVSAKAPIMAFLSTPERAFAVADLTEGYKPKLTRAVRGLAVLDRRQVLVQDEVTGPELVEIVWNFHTRAKIELAGDRATLSQGKVKLEARILSPEGAKFAVVSANPPKPQRQNPDVSNLVIRLPGKVKDARIAVLLAPGGVKNVPVLEPLEKWIAAGKLK